MGDFDFDDAPARRRPTRPPPLPPSNSLGITSLVIGVACLPLMCVPAVGALVIPLGGLGLLLGFVGLLVSVSRHGHGIGFPVGGIAVNAVAVTVAVVATHAFVEAFRNVEQQPRPGVGRP